MELFVFSFFFMDLKCTIQYPNDMQLKVWLFRQDCTAYTASTHVHKWLRLSSTMIFLLPIFLFQILPYSPQFILSPLVLLVTMVHRNYIAGSMSGLSHFSTHISFSTIECRMSASLFYIIVKLSSIFYKHFLSRDDTVTLSSSLNK